MLVRKLITELSNKNVCYYIDETVVDGVVSYLLYFTYNKGEIHECKPIIYEDDVLYNIEEYVRVYGSELNQLTFEYEKYSIKGILSENKDFIKNIINFTLPDELRLVSSTEDVKTFILLNGEHKLYSYFEHNDELIKKIPKNITSPIIDINGTKICYNHGPNTSLVLVNRYCILTFQEIRCEKIVNGDIFVSLLLGDEETVILTSDKAYSEKMLLDKTRIYIEFILINNYTGFEKLQYANSNRVYKEKHKETINDALFITLISNYETVKVPVKTIKGVVSLNKYSNLLNDGTYGAIREVIIPEGVFDLNISFFNIKTLSIPSSLTKLILHKCELVEELIIPDDSKLMDLSITNTKIVDLTIKYKLDKLTLINNLNLKTLRLLKDVNNVIVNDNSILTSINFLGKCNELDVSNNKLTEIFIPEGCSKINVNDNQLTELVIPEGCINFAARNNKLTNLVLSNTVEDFDVSDNNLLNLKTTDSVKSFNANNNQLINLKLNKGLVKLDIKNNNLTDIFLPSSCQNVNALGNPIKNIKFGQKTTGIYIDKRPEFVSMNKKIFNYFYITKNKDGLLEINLLNLKP